MIVVELTEDEADAVLTKLRGGPIPFAEAASYAYAIVSAQKKIYTASRTFKLGKKEG